MCLQSYRHSEVRLVFSQRHVDRQSGQITLVCEAAEIKQYTHIYSTHVMPTQRHTTQCYQDSTSQISVILRRWHC